MHLENIKRVLVYTHNSIGLGHAFRTLAVISGIKKWRPDIDFLVISGTSIPQIFFSEGIEVIKLPSIKLDIDRDDNRMSSRYLSGFEVENIFDFRQRLILDTFEFFKPDVLMVEHNMTGQMSELIPLLIRKWMRRGGPMDFVLVHLCRGIMRWVPILKIPYQNPRHRSESINLGSLYDFMYVLEDRDVIDINKEFLGNDPELEPKIKYLGKITNRVHDELPARSKVLARFGLPDKPIILMSLGRNRFAASLTERILQSLITLGLKETYQAVIIVDPYMDKDKLADLQTGSLSDQVRFLPFTPNLVDLIHHSELIIARAGYNTVNELLLTGRKAILVPERHGGGEQELRAASIQRNNIRTLSEQEVLSQGPESLIHEMLKSNVVELPMKFNKYAIGKQIVQDIELIKAHYLACKCH